MVSMVPLQDFIIPALAFYMASLFGDAATAAHWHMQCDVVYKTCQSQLLLVVRDCTYAVQRHHAFLCL